MGFEFETLSILGRLLSNKCTGLFVILNSGLDFGFYVYVWNKRFATPYRSAAHFQHLQNDEHLVQLRNDTSQIYVSRWHSILHFIRQIYTGIFQWNARRLRIDIAVYHIIIFKICRGMKYISRILFVYFFTFRMACSLLALTHCR